MSSIYGNYIDAGVVCPRGNDSAGWIRQGIPAQRDIVDRVAKEVLGAAGLTDQKYLIGTMIEIVRGAMTADEIARDAEFFSFGTNGRVIKEAIRLGRQTRPDLEIGICGEHGGDPESVVFCYHVGMDYVSCSPYRVPIARLAAAPTRSESMRSA